MMVCVGFLEVFGAGRLALGLFFCWFWVFGKGGERRGGRNGRGGEGGGVHCGRGREPATSVGMGISVERRTGQAMKGT